MKKPGKTLMIGLCTILAMAFLSTRVWAIALSFDPSASEIYVGDSVDIDIVISDLTNDNLAGFDLTINYDSSILAFDSHTLGTELGDIDLFEASDWTVGDNLVEVSWIWDPVFWSNQPDSFTLATISFTGISGGISDLFFSDVILSDDSWPAVAFSDVTLETGSVDVAPVPEPTTMLLFGTGLAGLVGFRKKFKK